MCRYGYILEQYIKEQRAKRYVMDTFPRKVGYQGRDKFQIKSHLKHNLNGRDYAANCFWSYTTVQTLFISFGKFALEISVFIKWKPMAHSFRTETSVSLMKNSSLIINSITVFCMFMFTRTQELMIQKTKQFITANLWLPQNRAALNGWYWCYQGFCWCSRINHYITLKPETFGL